LCSGNTYEFYNGGPAENGFKFCPYCGKQVKEQYKETDDAEM
jgi:rRNA maturation endonuclease Nob1